MYLCLEVRLHPVESWRGCPNYFDSAPSDERRVEPGGVGRFCPSPCPGEAAPAPEDQARAKPRRVESGRRQGRIGRRALPTATSPPLTMLPPATTIHPQSHRRRATTQAQQVSPLMLTSHQYKRMTSCLDHCSSRHACFDSTVLFVCSTAQPGRAVSGYGGQSGIMLLPPPSLSSTWYCTADNRMVI